jgi:hypothetical protein
LKIRKMINSKHRINQPGDTMKAKLKLLAIFHLLSSIYLSAHAQGSLTPPGAPAPTMKTLDQVEARTAITNATGLVTISQPGSYYLTHNIAVSSGNAISITTNGVTLDLNGFTISSTEASPTGTGISLANPAGNSDITILNGHIRGGVVNNAGVFSGSGFANGITFFAPSPSNVRIAGVSVSGCLVYGIHLGTDIGSRIGYSTVVESCTVQNIGSYGIEASAVSHSTADLCGSIGVFADSAFNCYGYVTGSGGIGLFATTANNCYGYTTDSSGSGYGLYADSANNCYGYSSSATGLNAGAAQNCQGYSSSGGPGISAETASNCYGQGLIRGISANVAISCSGRSFGGSYGVFATSIANTCYGLSATGTGLGANIAIGCIGVNNSGPSVLASYKYNMPP